MKSPVYRVFTEFFFLVSTVPGNGVPSSGEQPPVGGAAARHQEQKDPQKLVENVVRVEEQKRKKNPHRLTRQIFNNNKMSHQIKKTKSNTSLHHTFIHRSSLHETPTRSRKRKEKENTTDDIFFWFQKKEQKKGASHNKKQQQPTRKKNKY